jgi:hypothetical protein
MYKRPSLDKETYYKITIAAAKRKMNVKAWLMEAINEKLNAESAQDTTQPNS